MAPLDVFGGGDDTIVANLGNEHADWEEIDGLPIWPSALAMTNGCRAPFIVPSRWRTIYGTKSWTTCHYCNDELGQHHEAHVQGDFHQLYCTLYLCCSRRFDERKRQWRRRGVRYLVAKWVRKLVNPVSSYMMLQIWD